MPSFFKDPLIKGVLCLHTDLTVTGVRRVATLHTQPTVQICQSEWLEFTCNSGSPPRTLNWVTTSSYFQRTNYLTMGFLHGLVKPVDHRHHAGPHTDSTFPMPTPTTVQGCPILLLEDHLLQQFIHNLN